MVELTGVRRIAREFMTTEETAMETDVIKLCIKIHKETDEGGTPAVRGLVKASTFSNTMSNNLLSDILEAGHDDELMSME